MDCSENLPPMCVPPVNGLRRFPEPPFVDDPRYDPENGVRYFDPPDPAEPSQVYHMDMSDAAYEAEPDDEWVAPLPVPDWPAQLPEPEEPDWSPPNAHNMLESIFEGVGLLERAMVCAAYAKYCRAMVRAHPERD